jgi:hypothetical protein
VYVKERLQEDVGSSSYDSKIRFKDVVETFKDCKYQGYIRYGRKKSDDVLFVLQGRSWLAG